MSVSAEYLGTALPGRSKLILRETWYEPGRGGQNIFLALRGERPKKGALPPHYVE